jgi:hypothetical protein
MNKKFSKLLTTAIVASSLVFSAQSAFAATKNEVEPNDGIYQNLVNLDYGDIGRGWITHSGDRDWWTFSIKPGSGGRKVVIHLEVPEGARYDLTSHKNQGESFSKTWLNYGPDSRNVGFEFIAEEGAVYRILVDASSSFNQNAPYFLIPTIF